MRKTPNLGLNKPELNDYVDVDVHLNENFDTLDAAVAGCELKLSTAAKKDAIADADALVATDSAAEGKTKRITWAVIVNALKAMFSALVHGHKIADVEGLETAMSNKLSSDAIVGYEGAKDLTYQRFAMVYILENSSQADIDEALAKADNPKMLFGGGRAIFYRLYFVDGIGSTIFGGGDTVIDGYEDWANLYGWQVAHNYSRGVIRTRYKYNGVWSDLIKTAIALTPEEYGLPLQSAWSGNAAYTKTQENVCTVLINTQKNAQISSFDVIGNLPSGFRPRYTAYYPAVSFGPNVPLTVSINTEGQIAIGDASGMVAQRHVYMSATFICA